VSATWYPQQAGRKEATAFGSRPPTPHRQSRQKPPSGGFGGWVGAPILRSKPCPAEAPGVLLWHPNGKESDGEEVYDGRVVAAFIFSSCPSCGSRPVVEGLAGQKVALWPNGPMSWPLFSVGYAAEDLPVALQVPRSIGVA